MTRPFTHCETTMDTSKLAGWQRQIRQNIRNAFLTATRAELVKAVNNYPDDFSKECVREIIAECDAAGVDDAGKRPA